VAEHAGGLGIDPARIAVGGDSAGGNLAAAVAIKAREEDGPALAYQLLVYPATEHDLDKPSALENAEGYMLQRESMRWFWGHYLDGATDEPDWRASPLRAASLADLPPALVVTAEFDPLRDEGHAFAERIRAAGGTAEDVCIPGIIHHAPLVPKKIPAGARVIDDACDLLRTLLS
jgi:acetyl esterase